MNIEGRGPSRAFIGQRPVGPIHGMVVCDHTMALQGHFLVGGLVGRVTLRLQPPVGVGSVLSPAQNGVPALFISSPPPR